MPLSAHSKITLHNFKADELPIFYQRLSHIQKHGMPNYFGYQRFGKEDNFEKSKAIINFFIKILTTVSSKLAHKSAINSISFWGRIALILCSFLYCSTHQMLSFQPSHHLKTPYIHLRKSKPFLTQIF